VTVLRPAAASSTVATAHGTFGELLQGVLPDGDTDFLVTLPVTRQSTATFEASATRGIRVWPPNRWKAERLAGLMLAAQNDVPGGTLRLAGDLPVGKGMASSSADLVATARAVGKALGMRTDPGRIEAWLRRIEPTDGVMYPGVVAFEHRNVRLRASLGHLPPAVIVGLDEGGMVDTIRFNQLMRTHSAEDKHEYARMLAELSEAIGRRDLNVIGEIATRSCVLADRFRPRPALPALLRIRDQVGAAGIVCAHSGTMLGLLFAAGEEKTEERVRLAVRECRAISESVSVHQCLSAAPGTVRPTS